MWLLTEFLELQNTVRESQCRPAMQAMADEIFQVQHGSPSAAHPAPSEHRLHAAMRPCLVPLRAGMQLSHGPCSYEGRRGVQAAEDMIVRTQDALQALTAFDANAKKQQEADRTRSLSLVRAEKEEHDRHAPNQHLCCCHCLAVGT